MKLLLLSLLSLSLATLLPVSHAGSVICTPSPLELVFAVDVSSSLTKNDFGKVKGFLKSVAESFPLGPDNTRPALISFSTNAKVESNLGDADNVPAFRKAVDDIPYYRGFTATGMALRLARERVFVKSRTGASQLVVVVTDGRTNRPVSRQEALKILREESARLRGSGTRIHAVGVGGVQLKDELQEISGGDDYSMINDFDGLKELVNKLAKEICELHCSDVGKVTTIPGECYYGTQRITHITKKQNKQKNRCEKEISYEYKYCGKSHLCKEISTAIGRCVNGERDVVTSWEDFDVTKQKCEIKKAVEKQDCGAIEECKEPVADIVFVLDSSHSIKNHHWLMQLAFTQTLVQTLRVGPNAIRVGVVIFGKGAHLRIPLGSVTSKHQLLIQIASIQRLVKQNTATGLGIRMALQDFNQRGRMGVRQVAIVMADGVTNTGPRAIEEAAKLENAGVTIMSVGVGNGINRNELEGIATAPSHDHLFFPETFERLIEWASHISKKVCESITPPEPTLCDLPPQRVVSSCYKQRQKVTEIRYEFDGHGMCTKKMVSRVENKCKSVCLDPINGNQYQFGETWKTECSTFTCKKLPKPTSPMLPDSQGCLAANGTCYSPNANAIFGCHDEQGKLFSNCLCAKSNSVTVITEQVSP